MIEHCIRQRNILYFLCYFAPLLLSTVLLLSNMESVNFGYSMKNIPLPSNKEYTKRLIDKTESVIKRMRWKAYFYLHPEKKSDQNENFGFKSRKTPPQVEEMTGFEDDLLRVVENVQFKNVKCHFQSRLSKDVKSIKRSDHMFVPADKTSNYYKLTKPEYDKLLKDNTTAKYTRTNEQQINEINKEARNIAESLNLADRIEKVAEKTAFVTIKDHKENFPNHVQCRLINPAKTEIGVISKIKLDRINRDLTDATKVKQWKNTQCAIEWFGSINEKENCSFFLFDVVEFYPSISQQLLEDALEFASQYTKITDEEKQIIIHAKKTLLFHDKSPWFKSKQPHLFDVTMGSYDGAETCELVGTYLLNKIKHLFNNDVGLYRDDGLAVLRNHTPSEAERVAKNLITEMKKYGLKITVDHSMKSVNFLDTTLNLQENSYKPYIKPNNTTHYVNIKSNHPNNVTKTIPKSVNQRLSNISSDENQFNKSKTTYQVALANSGYKDKLEFQPNNQKQASRKRQRNIIWYNPPYSKNVATNIGRKFLNLIEKHFPNDNKLHKIFNKNNVKVSYSCTDNMGKIINAHNKAILNRAEETHEQACNCRNPAECPLNRKCLTKSIVYRAKVTSDREVKSYIGACETTFKERWRNHMSSIRLEHKKTQTALSQYIWNLKQSNINYNITWTIEKQTHAYSNISKRCQLCLWEKYFIITSDKTNTLNARSELVSKCRHQNKFLLCNT